MLSGSSWTTFQRFLPGKCCPKSIKTKLNRLFSCAMFSGASWTTLHNVLYLCYVVPNVLPNIDQGFFLCNVAWSLLDIITQGFYLFNVGLWLTDNFYEENNLCNVVLIILGQNCIGLLFSQCCLNTSDPTLHKKITCAMLAKGGTGIFSQEDKLYNIALICLSQHFARK